MRTLIAYLLALGAVTSGVLLGFPDLWRPAGADDLARAEPAAPPVIVAAVRLAPLADTLEALGTVRANESVEITPNAADHVETLHFTDGQEVEAGALLAQLEAAEERALLAEARALLDERRSAHERTVELFEQAISSQRDIEQTRALLLAAEARVASLEATIADHEVRAPFAGTLGLRRVSVGAFVQPATVLTTLDDLSVVKVDFTVPETWLAAVHVDQKLLAHSDAFGGRAFTGIVRAIETRLDELTRSAVVRAVVANDGRLLRPGMLLKIRVDRGEAPVLQVPEEAVVPIGDDSFVYLVGDDSVAHRTAVTTGRRRGGIVEIAGGLAEDDRVVVEGIVRVRDGAPVTVVGTRGDT